MIRFNKKDKNGRYILVNIVNDTDSDVTLHLYAEKPMRILFIKWSKMVKIKSDTKYIGHINKWTFRDYENWADKQIYLLNCQITREEERNRTAENIRRGRL